MGARGAALCPKASAAASSDASFTNTANSNIDVTVNTVHTHTAMSFGAAAATRDLIVAIAICPNAALGTITSVTIGGATATSLAEYTLGSGERVAFYGVTAGTGDALAAATSGNVVITNSSNLYATQVEMYRVLDGQLTVSDSATSNANPLSFATFDVPAGGIAFGIANHRANTNSTFTWTGIDETEDSVFSSGNNSCSMAAKAFAAAQTSLSVTCTPSGAGLRSPIGLVISIPKA